ncbi:MAG TPA: redox-regulated ATPase YchF [Bacteroidales bacterium]|nr:redox-regulated ATPase YchF [Bacteroidales bacterium]
MALQCGIIGIQGSGKTTLFNSISGTKAETAQYSDKANLGVIQVPDARLYELEKYQKTEKIVHATVNLVDIPGLARGSSGSESARKFLNEIRNSDAFIHVVRCFDNPMVPHPDGSVNPIRDVENIEIELQTRDAESVEKKIQRLEKVVKGGNKEAKLQIDALIEIKTSLENFIPVRNIQLSDIAKEAIADLFLLSAKPVLYVANVDSKSILSGNSYSKALEDYLKENNSYCLVVGAQLEAEIAELENKEDQELFLADAGLAEPGVNRLVQMAYSMLKLKTFFTVGPKEIKAWTIKEGMTAPQASGVIHSDLERGFIRAEVMKYHDFITLGSEAACKEKGKFYIEGKNYIVEDGDILHIRFNV